MSSKKGPWPSPAASNQLNNKYFVNQVKSNLNSSATNIDDELPMMTANPNHFDAIPTIATSRTVHSAEQHHKYFTSNASSQSSIETGTQISPATLSPKSRIKSTLSPSAVSNRTKTGQHHHHHQHGKNGAAAGAAAAPAVIAATSSTTTTTNRTHFQIAQKQLTLSKNIRTEPPPMLNHILDSLSVSNSKHLHHDHRFVFKYHFPGKLLALQWIDNAVFLFRDYILANESKIRRSKYARKGQGTRKNPILSRRMTVTHITPYICNIVSVHSECNGITVIH